MTMKTTPSTFSTANNKDYKKLTSKSNNKNQWESLVTSSLKYRIHFMNGWRVTKSNFCFLDYHKKLPTILFLSVSTGGGDSSSDDNNNASSSTLYLLGLNSLEQPIASGFSAQFGLRKYETTIICLDSKAATEAPTTLKPSKFVVF